MTGAERAVELRQQGCCCSQAVFAAYAKPLGLDRGNALKVATGFCGGIGHSADLCGAVSGAIMVIGLKHGSPIPGEQKQKAKVAVLAREFLKEFKARNGSVLCRDLLEYDISTPEGDKSARELGLFKTVCLQMVKSASEILDSMLARPNESN